MKKETECVRFNAGKKIKMEKDAIVSMATLGHTSNNFGQTSTRTGVPAVGVNGVIEFVVCGRGFAQKLAISFMCKKMGTRWNIVGPDRNGSAPGAPSWTRVIEGSTGLRVRGWGMDKKRVNRNGRTSLQVLEVLV